MGPRWNIIHWLIEDDDGGAFLMEDGLSMWQAQKRTGDYHVELGKNVNKKAWHDIFEKVCMYGKEKGWLFDFKLDNASYHKAILPGIPTKGKVKKWKLATLKKWLDEHDIPYDKINDHKPVIQKLVVDNLPDPRYLAEEIAEKYGHRIHWTPQYHPELQPIETIWAWVKNYVRRKNKKKNMKEVGEFVRQGFNRIQHSSICKLIKKVERQEIEYYELANSKKSKANVLWLSRDLMYDTESDSEPELDDNVDIGDVMSGHESDSDPEEEPNNPISDDDQ